MSVARDLIGNTNHVIAVIGDGAMSAGMAYEAMNNAGTANSRLLVILNDNDMSIAPAVGAMSAYLSQLISSKPYRNIRELVKQIAQRFPKQVEVTAKRAEEYARGLVTGGTLFEELGFYYIGPVDGHNMDHLLPVLENIRDATQDKPVLLHVVTEKGRGHPFGEQSVEKYHAVQKFDLVTGTQTKPKANAPTYTDVYATALIAEAADDASIVAITAAMPSGTGINKFAEKFSERTFDVGIAEQHAVTFAAGMATEGLKPFVTIYSTFLQRAFDQVVHDVAIQELPVRFGIDRAGLVGADGATHAGSFDLTYLCCLPGFVVMAAADEADLMHMVATSASINDRPSAVRYPRGEGIGIDLPVKGVPLEIGKGRVLREGNTVAILSLGGRLSESLLAADDLATRGLMITVADARFAKPIDQQLIQELASSHDILIIIEEGSVGGFSSHVLDFLTNKGLLDGTLKVRTMCLPDRFLDHNSPEMQYKEAGLDAEHIVKTALLALGHKDEMKPVSA